MVIEQLEGRVLLSAAVADANGDQRVDTSDFACMASHFGLHPASKSQGDFNGDGVVNSLDFNILASAFGQVMATTTVNHSGTDTDSATALQNALAAASSGDTIIVGVGTFDGGSGNFIVPSGVNLTGSGNNSDATLGTVLKSTRANTSGVIVNPCGSQTIRDLFIQGTPAPYASTFAACIGFCLDHGDTAGTSVALVNVGGITNGIPVLFHNASAQFPTINWTMTSCNFTGNDDCVNCFGVDNTSAWPFKIVTTSCNFRSVNDGQSPFGVGAITTYTARASGVIFEDHNSTFYANPGPAGVNQNGFCVATQSGLAASPPTINLFGSHLILQDDGTAGTSLHLRAFNNGTINVGPGVTHNGTLLESATGTGVIMSINYTTKSADPSTLPGGNGRWVTFSPNGNYVAVCSLSTPFVQVYAWSQSTGFGAKVADPATLPAGQGNSVIWSPDGNYIAVAHNTTPFVSVYPWTGSAFGAKVANPATVPDGNANGVTWSHGGTYIAVANALGDAIAVYPWSGGAFGTRIAGPDYSSVQPITTGNSVAFSPADDYIGLAGVGTPKLAAWPWNGTFGTVVADPSPAPASSGKQIQWSPDGAYVATCHATTPFVDAYAWSAGFGSKVSDPASLPPGNCNGLAWAADGATIAFASSTTPFEVVYPWAAGFGAKVAAPSSIPASNGNSVAFGPTAPYSLAVAHNTTPFVTAYDSGIVATPPNSRLSLGLGLGL